MGSFWNGNKEYFAGKVVDFRWDPENPKRVQNFVQYEDGEERWEPESDRSSCVRGATSMIRS